MNKADSSSFASIYRDCSLSAVVAGMVALVATYSGPMLIVVQAANAGHLSTQVLSTWIWALSVGAAALGLWFSVRLRVPVIGAWSTPGVALLISGLPQYSFSDIIGCYLILAAIVTVLGFSGGFGRFIKLLPANLLSAMLAGVLFQFCTKMFHSVQSSPAFVLPIIAVYFICKRLLPRYAVAIALMLGLFITLMVQPVAGKLPALEFVRPVLTAPTLSTEALIGLGLPLLMLAMTQYATAIAVLRNAGYVVSDNMVVGVSGLVSLPLSLFGSSGINPAAIVGAICAGPECHPEPERRYVAGIVCGLGYLLLGAFGVSVVGVFSLLSHEVIATLAGLALLSTLVSSLFGALAQEENREPAVIAFLVTASGVSFSGIGSALWGLLAGLVFSSVLHWSGFANAPAHEPPVRTP